MRRGNNETYRGGQRKSENEREGGGMEGGRERL